MADLSRVKGFRFNSVSVENSSGGDIFLLDVDKSAVPSMLYSEFNIPNRDGALIKLTRYENKLITVTIGVYGITATERRIKERNLMKDMLGIQGRLIFCDEPNLFYNAYVVDEVSRKETSTFTELGITFSTSPCMYELYDDLRDYAINELAGYSVSNLNGILVNKAAWQNITSRTVKTVINSGNYKALPTISISGTASLVTVQINDTVFNVSNISGMVYVNCEKMICYTYSTGSKVSKLADFTGIFPVILPGNNTVIIDGSNLTITELSIEYPNTYIV